MTRKENCIKLNELRRIENYNKVVPLLDGFKKPSGDYHMKKLQEMTNLTQPTLRKIIEVYKNEN